MGKTDSVTNSDGKKVIFREKTPVFGFILPRIEQKLSWKEITLLLTAVIIVLLITALVLTILFCIGLEKISNIKCEM